MPISRIHIIGLGIAAPAELSSASTTALLECDIVIGSPRQFDLIKKLLDNNKQKQRIELPKFDVLQSLIEQYDKQNIAVLASGDPLLYGIGCWLSRNFPLNRLCFHPAVSSIQVVCHRLGLALQDVKVVSLHGRPLSNIRRYLRQRQTLIVLTDKDSNPQALAKECIGAGFSDSQLTVCENLGYPDESIQQRNVSELNADKQFNCSPLNICVIEVRGEGGLLPEFPGFDDTLFVTDGAPGQGMISKREVRLAILSLLQPANDDVIWDLGAGCGGVSTELAYWNERVNVFAVEQHAQRLQCLEANREKFGVTTNFHVIEGRMPEALQDLPAANKVFIGGSDGELQKLLDRVWADLPDRGLLVATAVTDETLKQLEHFSMQLEIEQLEMIRLAVSRGRLSEQTIQYQEKLPVTLFKFIKRDIAQ